MTNLKRQIIKNSLSIYIGKALSLGISFFVFISIANYLGDVNFGKLSTAITYISAFDFLANFGINQIIIRELAANRFKYEKVIASGLIIKLAVTFFAFGLSLFLLIFLNYTPEIIAAIIIISFNLFISSKLSSTRTIFETVFQARLDMAFPMFFVVLDNILFAAAFYYSRSHFSLSMLQIAIIYTFTNLPGFLAIIYLFFREVKPELAGTWELTLKLFRESVPLAVYLFFSILSTKVDILMLSHLASESEVGIYSAAVRLVYPLMFFSTSFTLSLFPLLAKYYGQNEAKFNSIFFSGVKIVALLAIIISVPLTIKAENIFKTLYIKEYWSGIMPFQILIITLGFSFFNFYFIDLLIAIKQQKALTYLLGAILMINVLLNLLLIPKYSFLGSSMARLVCAVLLFIMLIRVLKHYLKISKVLNINIILFTIAFIFFQIIIRNLSLSLYFLVCTFLFVSLIFLFRVFKITEAKQLVYLITKEKIKF